MARNFSVMTQSEIEERTASKRGMSRESLADIIDIVQQAWDQSVDGKGGAEFQLEEGEDAKKMSRLVNAATQYVDGAPRVRKVDARNGEGFYAFVFAQPVAVRSGSENGSTSTRGNKSWSELSDAYRRKLIRENPAKAEALQAAEREAQAVPA